jgi:2-hydroxy-3-keto-5-methylthiopentenyl-1-phosphate phosphatase
MALKVFVEFYGPVTPQGAERAFFRRFAGPVSGVIAQQYLDGTISAKECIRREIDAVGSFNRSEIERFFLYWPIDPAFKEFVTFCRSYGIEVYVVSDGLDYSIRAILAANCIDGVSSFGSALEFLPPDCKGDSRLSVRFPYDDAECTRCACCRRNIMLTFAGDDDIIVYVGDGYSDGCPARFADIVFVRGRLQAFCQRENISYLEYCSFHTVIQCLEKLLTAETLRKRRRADLNRREMFMRE